MQHMFIVIKLMTRQRDKQTRASRIRFLRFLKIPPKRDFLADRTNGRAYATVLRLSSSSVVVVCNVMYCG